jgi:hypothetical protein
MTTPTAYPLTWPPGFARKQYREQGAFKTDLNAAIKNVQKSLELFAKDSGKKLEGLVVSSNVTLGVNAPADPGVAVWFTWDGMQVCIPVDRYTKVASNLQAIHHIIEARRVELRHGTLALVRASFTGFRALPPPAGKHWAEVLAIPRDATRMDIEAAHRRLSMQHHPDRGGSQDKMAEINAARDTALKEMGNA